MKQWVEQGEIKCTNEVILQNMVFDQSGKKSFSYFESRLNVITVIVIKRLMQSYLRGSIYGTPHLQVIAK